MDIWIVSIFWLKWVKQLEIFLYKILCAHVLISLRYILSGIIWSNGNSMFNLLRNSKCFLKWLHRFLFPPPMNEGSNFSTALSTFVIIWIFEYMILAIQISVKHYLNVAYISLKTNDVDSLFVACWPFLYLSWRKVYSVVFPAPPPLVSFITLVLNGLDFTYHL